MTQTLDTTRLASRAPSRRTGGPLIGRLPGPGFGCALAASLLISACTALPEWADPGGWFEEDTPPPSRITAGQNLEQAQSGGFPNLASVPNEPRQATPAAQRNAIAAGLTADRSNARYSGERLVAGGAKAPDSAPAAPNIARSLGVSVAQAPAAAPRPAAEAPPPAVTPSATMIAPAPAQKPAQKPAQEPAQTLAQGSVVVPGPAAAPGQTLARPVRSEMAAVIYFADGSDLLDDNDRAVLRDVVALSRERDATIRVIGHASARTRTVDPVQHQVANLEISQRRADAVAAALIRLGAKRDRIRIEARADTVPVFHEFMPTGEAGNRRADIFLEY